MPRDSYPTEIDHPSWPYDRACPLYLRMWATHFCRRAFNAPDLEPIPFGCRPDCDRREAALEEPALLADYERKQNEISHHGIDGYGMGLWERKK